ncbi:MAG TPA: hypothetical protein VE224_13010 [Pseudolabrys sp.]|nr:hypothetical protein [Pseudolabrys sp.]
MQHIGGNVVHTVNFMQGAITTIMALALGEALKVFVSGHDDTPLQWARLPALLAFLFVFVPFFQSISQFLYLTYLNPQTAPVFRPRFLLFDGIMYILEAACFYVMSHALAPRHWRHFYGAVLVLMAIDIVWSGITYRRGIHVGAWIYIDAVIIVLLGGTMLYARGKHWQERGLTMLPSYILMVVLGVTTAFSYWLESAIYFP